YQSYLKDLLAGNRRQCYEFLEEELKRGRSLKSVYLDLMQRALNEVGSLWERNKISVATEHLASSTTETLLARIYPLMFLQPHKDLRAIISCVPHEQHQIGSRMVADFFELHGWHGYHLGANTPVGGLLQMIRERDPDIVGLSMGMLFNLPKLEEMLEAITAEFPGLDLLIGGRAFFGEGGKEVRSELIRRFDKLHYFASLDELEEYLLNV
ncbi:MAG: cobalamin-dependent protein, partial [Deltaproteobacteria bacterium]|nr:cobalamin-dependent protein [Deltaproteobacteria bacterium]